MADATTLTAPGGSAIGHGIGGPIGPRFGRVADL